jgi:hypothetical protein
MFPWRFALRSLVFVAIVVGYVGGLCLIWRSWHALLAGAVCLVFYLPVVLVWLMPSDYWLGPGGVTVKNWFGAASYRWLQFRGWRVVDRTVELLFWPPPVREPSALPTWRNLDEVVAYVEAHVPKHCPEAEGDEP